MTDQKKGSRVWGYARVSTDDQELRVQISKLERYGVDGIFKEKKSGKDNNREVLNYLLHEAYLRPGDTVVVTKLDRLGRSLTGLIEIVEFIKARGAALVSLGDSIDTSNATGKFFFHLVAAMAEWERNMIAERTKAGMEAARAAGKRIGPPSLIKDNPKRMKHMRKLDKAGKLRDDKGKCILRDKELWDALNEGDPKSPIRSIETIRRWRREGYPGLEES